MKPRLFIRVPACEEVPRGYGLIYVDYLRYESVHTLVPLNVLLGWVRAAWLWAMHGYYTKGMAKREKAAVVARREIGLAWTHADRLRAGILLRWGSCWIGWHWSRANRRLCINLIPCVTIWIVGAGGVVP